MVEGGAGHGDLMNAFNRALSLQYLNGTKVRKQGVGKALQN